MFNHPQFIRRFLNRFSHVLSVALLAIWVVSSAAWCVTPLVPSSGSHACCLQVQQTLQPVRQAILSPCHSNVSQAQQASATAPCCVSQVAAPVLQPTLTHDLNFDTALPAKILVFNASNTITRQGHYGLLAQHYRPNQTKRYRDLQVFRN